ncbi:MAG: flagellar basal body L-ring protein FlgH [Elusimicrobia bacterium]|nr:flagellar basal body L-ring protein FlgH [Elusimicrobiota bacterium]
MTRMILPPSMKSSHCHTGMGWKPMPQGMKRMILIPLLFLTVACAKTVIVQAPPVEPPMMMLFSDPRASRVGDLVTVNIVENSKGSRKVSSLADKESDLSADVKTTNTGRNSINKLGLKITNDTKAESGLERRGSLVAAVTARVTEVMPDGNLRIEAEQEIVLEGAPQTIKLKGILRPADIGPGNTVNSTRLANAKIEYRSRKEPGLHHQGILSTLFGWVF